MISECIVYSKGKNPFVIGQFQLCVGQDVKCGLMIQPIQVQ